MKALKEWNGDEDDDCFFAVADFELDIVEHIRFYCNKGICL